MKPDLDVGQQTSSPPWENPRVQLLDDVWLITIVAILAATGVPWFASGFAVDVGTASWGLLALGGIHVAFSACAASTRSHGRWRVRMLTLLHLAGVILIGFIWRHVGSIENPMFLAVFALPVIGAIFLSRWHPYLVAAVSIIVAAAVAFIQMPEFRWYLTGLVGGNEWVNELFANQRAVPQSSFAGFYAPLNYLVVLLEVFAILLLACAVAAEYIGAIFERLNANIVLAGNEVELGQKAWADLIERLPLPALLVDPYTLRIAACSRLASTYLHAGDPPLEGRSVLEVLRPSFPDVIQDLVNGVADEAPITAIRVADQLRVTQMSVQHLAHKERRLALLTITDRTEAFCMKAALDASDHATLVIDVRGSVMAFNRLARDLFAGVAVGADAAHLLEPSDPALRWWDPGLTGRRKMHIQIGQHVFQIISSSIALAGEEERIFAVALLPVANAADAERSAAGGAVITRFRGRP